MFELVSFVNERSAQLSQVVFNKSRDELGTVLIWGWKIRMLIWGWKIRPGQHRVPVLFRLIENLHCVELVE